MLLRRFGAAFGPGCFREQSGASDFLEGRHQFQSRLGALLCWYSPCSSSVFDDRRSEEPSVLGHYVASSCDPGQRLQ